MSDLDGAADPTDAVFIVSPPTGTAHGPNVTRREEIRPAASASAWLYTADIWPGWKALPFLVVTRVVLVVAMVGSAIRLIIELVTFGKGVMARSS